MRWIVIMLVIVGLLFTACTPSDEKLLAELEDAYYDVANVIINDEFAVVDLKPYMASDPQAQAWLQEALDDPEGRSGARQPWFNEQGEILVVTMGTIELDRSDCPEQVCGDVSFSTSNGDFTLEFAREGGDWLLMG